MKFPLIFADESYTEVEVVPGRGYVLPGGWCYFISSTKTTRITIAITKRQSMANVMAIRVQDDFLSMGPASFIRTARRSLIAARGPSARASGPISGIAALHPL